MLRIKPEPISPFTVNLRCAVGESRHSRLSYTRGRVRYPCARFGGDLPRASQPLNLVIETQRLLVAVALPQEHSVLTVGIAR
jgi:hypothetical protein